MIFVSGTNVILQGACLKGAWLENTKITVEQISQCNDIEGIMDVSAEFLIKIKKKNSKIMSWWHKGLIKETYQTGTWTGRWIEPGNEDIKKFNRPKDPTITEEDWESYRS